MHLTVKNKLVKKKQLDEWKCVCLEANMHSKNNYEDFPIRPRRRSRGMACVHMQRRAPTYYHGVLDYLRSRKAETPLLRIFRAVLARHRVSHGEPKQVVSLLWIPLRRY